MESNASAEGLAESGELHLRAGHHGAVDGKKVGLTERVLGEAGVEADNVPDACKVFGGDLETLGRDKPGDALATGGSSERAGIAEVMLAYQELAGF